MGTIFKFKHFQIDQRGCAMKINTDGVLLGAVADHEQPRSVLDIGTGTGVIALMLAQRFRNAEIDALEIDFMAAEAAQINCANSPYALRSKVFATSFEEFSSSQQYDLIVSNPPYFVNDLKNTEKRKELARHTSEGFFDLLLKKSAALLHPQGRIWLILPVKQAEKLVVNAVLHKLFLSKVIHVHSDQDKPAFRQIICLDFNRSLSVQEEHIYIYAALGEYTVQYKTLLRDFFLAF